MKTFTVSVFLIALVESCTSTHQCVILSDKFNIFIVNVPNPITISIEGSIVRDYTVETNNGRVIKEKEKYFIEPSNTGLCDITVTLKSGGEKYLLPFRVKDIDKPFTYLPTGLSSYGSATIRDRGSIAANWENLDYDVKLYIISYDVVVERNGAQIGEVKNNGSYFNENTIRLLDQQQVGDKIYFKNVICKFDNGNTIEALPYILIAK